MQNLPINLVLDEIKQKLNHYNRLVLQAPPGAGKTTAVPIALLNQSWLQDKQIIMLEPRRLAARNAAARMAHLLNEKVGETVGYQIRQDNCFSDKTKILVVTEGILTRKIQADPELAKTALVIFDEFHERSLHADLSLALCLQSQQVLHEDLKILVMSATLNTQGVTKLLDDAPLIESQGRSYPVEIKYLDKPLKQSGSFYENQQQLILTLFQTIIKIINEQQGSCLVFLPGVKEINQLAGKLKQFVADEKHKHILIAPLHGSLTKQQQDKAISAVENNYRKIVLATNIAETSLTIEGINCVVDSGLGRVLEYSPSSAMNALNTHQISVDSATQRSGRAGRLSEGVCYRMWTLQQHHRRQKHSLPELLHSDLSSLVLELANWGVRQVDELEWMDLPPTSAVEQASYLLRHLKAIDYDGKITHHGRDILKLGVHPRLAHMILSSVSLGQAYHACLIAALLSERDIYNASANKSADIYERIQILSGIELLPQKNYGLDLQQCKRVIQTADEFYKRLKRNFKVSDKKDVNLDYSGVLLAFAYSDRIAKQRKPDSARYLLSSGKGCIIPEFLQHHLYEYLVVANLDAKLAKGEARIYLFSQITVLQLEMYFEDLIEISEDTEWNEKLQRVETKITHAMGSIILSQKKSEIIEQKKIQQCLLAGVSMAGLNCLNWSQQAISLKQRLEFIHQQSRLKKLSFDFPCFSDEYLITNLSEWLQPYLNKENSIKQCQKLDLFKILESHLSWEQKQAVDRLAPDKISVPSGSSIKIDYTDPLQPVLAVKLQEVFGLFETPAILDGQCQLMMHLLSPARRPMQVTQDLNSFWKTTYHEVKKELRGKYKRHYWPDDPFSATPTSKTKKNMHR